jgi:hypothetical protein
MKLDRDAFSEVFMVPRSTVVSSGFTFSSNWRGFELKQNDQIVATLKQPTVWSSNFLASTSSEQLGHPPWRILGQ